MPEPAQGFLPYVFLISVSGATSPSTSSSKSASSLSLNLPHIPPAPIPPVSPPPCTHRTSSSRPHHLHCSIPPSNLEAPQRVRPCSLKCVSPDLKGGGMRAQGPRAAPLQCEKWAFPHGLPRGKQTLARCGALSCNQKCRRRAAGAVREELLLPTFITPRLLSLTLFLPLHFLWMVPVQPYGSRT